MVSRQSYLAARHVQEVDVGVGEGIRHPPHDRVAQLSFEVASRYTPRDPLTFSIEDRGIADAECVDPVGAQAHRAELPVADGDRSRRAPFLIQPEARREKVDVALERRLEHLVPIQQVRQQRQSVGAQPVQARREDIADAAFIHEHRQLRTRGP